MRVIDNVLGPEVLLIVTSTLSNSVDCCASYLNRFFFQSFKTTSMTVWWPDDIDIFLKSSYYSTFGVARLNLPMLALEHTKALEFNIPERFG